MGQDPLVQLLGHIERALGDDWAEYPGGWPEQIEAALIDAVLSIRARYGHPARAGSAATGIPAAVQRWIVSRDAQADDLRVLAAADPEEVAEILHNRQVLSGNLPKAAGIVLAATNLVGAGVNHAKDLDAANPQHRRAYECVRGLGPVTWEYFCMLLGVTGVKADVWVIRFVDHALGSTVSPAEARQLVIAAASELKVSPTHLDHAIWAATRSRKR